MGSNVILADPSSGVHPLFGQLGQPLDANRAVLRVKECVQSFGSQLSNELGALDNRKPSRLPTMCHSMDPSAATERHLTLNVRICGASVLTNLLGGSHFNMASYLYFTVPLCETPQILLPASALDFSLTRPLLLHLYTPSH